MSYSSAADALMRRKLLEQMYDRMTDEEKRIFAMMTMQNKNNGEILQAIRQNQQHLEYLVEHTDRDQWYKAFGSDVAANVLTTSAFWLLGKLFAKR
jgi:prephenate dehydrogenase